MDDAENGVKNVRGWRKIARDKDTWKLILKDRILHEL
jgi:hypothetical protein